MSFFPFIFAIYFICQYVGAVPHLDPLVYSNVGLIQGLAANDGDYNMFLGIPYAKVDEKNPFGAAEPHIPFKETFKAFDDSALCPQIDEFTGTTVGTLDCLHLNVYAPTTASSGHRLPVLVWIHGGRFEIGSSGRIIYGPKFLVRHGIILVTLNYRLGPYGFMCLNIPAVPGNQGLRDQELALSWVKNNIDAFGGDRDKITLFGLSAGSVCVDFHIHQREKLLFKQAILQSGTILNPWAVQNPGNKGLLQLAKYFGFSSNKVTEALSFLATVDTNLVIAATNKLGLVFRPCVEKKFKNVTSFLTEHPVNLKTPNVKNIPLLIGFNNDEGVIAYGNANAKYLEKLDIVSDKVTASFNFNARTFQEMTDILRRFYFSDKGPSNRTRREIINVVTDFDYAYPTQRSIRKYFDSGAESIFSYVFSYVGKRNYAKYRNNINFGGAAHADQISYLFDVSFMKTIMSDEEQVVVERITTLWTNFAKYGNPTPETSELLPVTWVPATRDRWNSLNIDSELTMEAIPLHDRMAFLDLFYKIYEKNQIGYCENNVFFYDYFYRVLEKSRIVTVINKLKSFSKMC